MEKKPGIDDAISAVSVHGVIGIWGVLSVRLFAVAYPFFTGSGPVAAISLTGQPSVQVSCSLSALFQDISSHLF